MFQFKVWKNKNIFSVVNKETSMCWKQKKLYLTLSFQSSINASRLEKPWPWDRSWPRLEPELLRGCWRMPRKSLHFHPRHPECWHLHARTREHSSQRCNGKQQPAVEWEVFWEVRHPFWLLQLYHPHLPCFSPMPSPEKDHFSRLHSIKVTNQPYHALVLFGSRSHVGNETLQRLPDLWKDLSPAGSLTLDLQLNPLQARQSKAVACSIRNDSCGSHLRPSRQRRFGNAVFCMKKKQHQWFWKKVSWNTQNTVPKTEGSIFWPKHTRSGVFFSSCACLQERMELVEHQAIHDASNSRTIRFDAKVSRAWCPAGTPHATSIGRDDDGTGGNLDLDENAIISQKVSGHTFHAAPTTFRPCPFFKGWGFKSKKRPWFWWSGELIKKGVSRETKGE